MGADEKSLVREGRSDSAETLLLRLGTAEADYLDAALENPALGLAQAARLLKNHRCRGETLARLGEREALVRHREIRMGLATHPSTPRPLAVHLLSLLGWNDLARVAGQPRTPAPVQHQAERLLADRIDSLAVGELVSLARLAPRRLFPLLRRQARPRIIEAFLQNPRLTEADVLASISSSETPPRLLGAVARAGRWSSSRVLRLAVARHRNTPATDALRSLRSLTLRDLEGLAADPTAPTLVRRGAERLIESRGGAV
jgi:hypothetical protein